MHETPHVLSNLADDDDPFIVLTETKFIYLWSDVRLNSRMYRVLLVHSIATESGRLRPKITSW